MAIALLYHDVIDDPAEPSGFDGPIAQRYKLSRGAFDAHLEALASLQPPVASPAAALSQAGGAAWMLTFDDGGITAYTAIADALERRGWRGMFFITTGRLGTPGFLDAEQVRAMHDRGHLIGSHSETHPPRMSTLSSGALLGEWQRSCDTLAELLGVATQVASVPGGYYSRPVARAASAAGIRYLFTSEPTARPHRIEDCMVLGRYTLLRDTPAGTAAAIGRGAAAPRLAQYVSWNGKKLIKAALGHRFAAASGFVLRRGRNEEGRQTSGAAPRAP